MTLKLFNSISIIFLSVTLLQCNTKSNWKNEIDTIFVKEFNANAPGGAVLIMKDEKIAFSKGYGLADLGTKEKITPQTLFNTGSISKTFVSNVILDLANEGKLSLQDSLTKYCLIRLEFITYSLILPDLLTTERPFWIVCFYSVPKTKKTSPP